MLIVLSSEHHKDCLGGPSGDDSLYNQIPIRLLICKRRSHSLPFVGKDQSQGFGESSESFLLGSSPGGCD